ncbi:hypothetical protein MAR_028277 [Mya arenaria]|uniref:Uncharacterized protein n=1 Tax=Mya arenaria TaxID=6604 RepID=A0ABY7DD57_MYAAR|nr:hypothetical protein MAR_028277 [Mya arenaria]
MPHMLQISSIQLKFSVTKLRDEEFDGILRRVDRLGSKIRSDRRAKIRTRHSRSTVDKCHRHQHHANDRLTLYMKRIKNYFRSTMSTDRISSLALLHIHKDKDINNVINTFA